MPRTTTIRIRGEKVVFIDPDCAVCGKPADGVVVGDGIHATGTPLCEENYNPDDHITGHTWHELR